MYVMMRTCPLAYNRDGAVARLDGPKRREFSPARDSG